MPVWSPSPRHPRKRPGKILVLFALRDSVVGFHFPKDVVEKQIPADRRIRLGGLVAPGSVKRGEGLIVQFGITDMVHTLPIEGHECRDPKDLADMARKQGFKAHPRETIGQALAAIRRPSRALVFGSLYLAGEALAANGNIPD